MLVPVRKTAEAATGQLRARWLAIAGMLTATMLVAVPQRSPADDGPRNALPPPAPQLRLPQRAVLFYDDFGSDSLKHWTTDRPEVWSVRRGMLRGDLPDRKQERALIYTGSGRWTHYAVDLDVCMMRGVDKGVVLRADGDNGIGIDMRGPGYQDVLLQHGWRTLGRAPVVNGNATWHHLRVEARGHRYRVFVNGHLVIDKVDGRESSENGRIAIFAYTGGVGECTVYYDNVVVTALGGQRSAGKEP